jgi:hypothetical protein
MFLPHHAIGINDVCDFVVTVTKWFVTAPVKFKLGHKETCLLITHVGRYPSCQMIDFQPFFT